jgi:hypothetical protein
MGGEGVVECPLVGRSVWIRSHHCCSYMYIEGMSALVFDRHATSIEGLLMRRFRFLTHVHNLGSRRITFCICFIHRGVKCDVNVYRIAAMLVMIAMMNSTHVVQ